MKQKPHPEYRRLKGWVLQHLGDAQPKSGEFYRVAGPRHATAAAIVSGTGAFIAGGRWSPIGVMNVVYLSTAPETATYESMAGARYYNLPLWDSMPKVMVAVRVEVDAILDLTNRAIGANLPVAMAALLGEDWRAVMQGGRESASQAIGRAAFAAGLQGLLVPSKAHRSGKNLLVFPASLSKTCLLEVMNPDALAKLSR